MSTTNTIANVNNNRTLFVGTDRTPFLPRNVKKYMHFENFIYSKSEELSPDYKGGMWKFYETKNGTFYMAPDMDQEKMKVSVAGNYYDGEMSPDAFGIMVTMYALHAFLMHHYEKNEMEQAERLNDQYYALRDFYLDYHPEAMEIHKALD